MSHFMPHSAHSLLRLAAPIGIASVLCTGCFQSEPQTADGKSAAAAVTSSNYWQTLQGSCMLPAFQTLDNEGKVRGWVLDGPVTTGGFSLYHYDKNFSSWMPGGLIDIDLMENAYLYGVNAYGNLLYNNTPWNENSSWTGISTPGTAVKLAVGNTPNHEVYITTIQNHPSGTGNMVWKRVSSGSWSFIDIGLVEIDLDNNGDLWGVDASARIWKLPGGDASKKVEIPKPYIPQSGLTGATEIAVGNGKVYILGFKTVPGGKRVAKLVNGTFQELSGGLMEIHVDKAGRLWGCNDGGYAFYYAAI